MLDLIAKAIDVIFNDTVASTLDLTAEGVEAHNSKNKWVRRLGKLSCFGAVVILVTGLAAIASLIYVAILFVRFLLSGI